MRAAGTVGEHPDDRLHDHGGGHGERGDQRQRLGAGGVEVGEPVEQALLFGGGDRGAGVDGGLEVVERGQVDAGVGAGEPLPDSISWTWLGRVTPSTPPQTAVMAANARVYQSRYRRSDVD
ncbi:hypothetical protein [Actinoplanes missouriensis]|uniref:hypothetical protein n=1 Tax=Actinoplanes missouriensis TaxID=1866 RepID=UPI00059F7E56|nr:hypothetical protein [Actinoplanes missouriensis]